MGLGFTLTALAPVDAIGYAFGVVLFCGLLREYSETTLDSRQWSDFRKENSGPQNGLVDVAAWGVGSGLWIVGTLIRSLMT